MTAPASNPTKPSDLHCNQPPIAPAQQASRRVLRVLVLTFACMLAEIAFGVITNSMALLADGWHMGTHVVAFAITLIAYRLSSRFSQDMRYARLFCWGPWKIEVLGGFTSGLLLMVVAAAVVWESILRLAQPTAIAFNEAMVVAAVGLAVNMLSAWWLHGGKAHEHGHSHDHDHHHHHHHGDHAQAHDDHADLNLRGAYLHVLADAATSILAIVALFGGQTFGWTWLDPAVGLVGAALITAWAIGLMRDTARVLLDAEMDTSLVDKVRGTLTDGATRIVDLHVWRVGRTHYSVAVSLEAREPRASDWYRERLAAHAEIVHATIEVNPTRAAALS
ncbi:MAG TPA: CDF family Co(II)/Ni(II) efflux transporter DmeF [Burkholderiaceae bacterium]|nr:CDF family Co(II)/Ni(II) efflux transporter DmeF [Burkholderiaceae bacterium]